MILNEQESRVALAALHTLEQTLSAEIQRFAAPDETRLTLPLRAALSRKETVATLARKLERGGTHRVDRREIALTIRGLDRYVDLLNDCVAAHEVEEDDLLQTPQRKGREIELHWSSTLLERLATN